MADFVVNCFILGAAKSGTTSLHSLLSQHPQVCMSVPKEPLYFESAYERGNSAYHAEHYRHYNGEPVVGEARPAHLLLPFVASRIAEYNAAAKLIVILRDPTERAFSHWWMRYTQCFENRSFPDAIADELAAQGEIRDIDASTWADSLIESSGASRMTFYLETGHFADQLLRYMSLFPKSQIKVLLFDHLRENVAYCANQAFLFLHLQPLQKLEPVDANVASGKFRRTLSRMRPFTRVGRLAPRRFRKRLVKKLMQVGSKPMLSDDVRKQLDSYFGEKNKKLYSILSDLDTKGLDDVSWLRRPK